MLDQIVTRVLAECPGIVSAVAKRAVKDASRELCRESNALALTATAVIPTGSSQGVLIAEIDEVEFLRLIDGGSASLQGDVIKLSSPVTEQITLTIKAACMPSITRTQIPDELAVHFDAIQNGALAYCLRMPYPWANLERSAFYEQQFRSAIHDIKQAFATLQPPKRRRFI